MSGPVFHGCGASPDQHETYVTTMTQPWRNRHEQPARAARLARVSGKDKRYLLAWAWLFCSAIVLILALWAKHMA